MEQSDLTVLQIHPLAEQFFPMMEEEELHALVESIQANGQRDPITLFDGHILDGRNRYTACTRLGIAPKTETFEGSERDAAAFVMDKNRHRRHLTVGQKAMAEAAYCEWYQRINKERQREGGKKGGKIAGSGRAKNREYQILGTPYLDEERSKKPLRTSWAHQAAQVAGVSHSTMSKAKHLLDHGTEEIITQVKTGKLSLEKGLKTLAPFRPDTAHTPASAPEPQPGAPAGPSAPVTRRTKRGKRWPEPEAYKVSGARPGLALDQLKYWWDLATPAQRDTFAEWTHTHEHDRQRLHPLIFVSPRLSLAGSDGSAPVEPGTNGTAGEPGD